MSTVGVPTSRSNTGYLRSAALYVRPYYPLLLHVRSVLVQNRQLPGRNCKAKQSKCNSWTVNLSSVHYTSSAWLHDSCSINVRCRELGDLSDGGLSDVKIFGWSGRSRGVVCGHLGVRESISQHFLYWKNKKKLVTSSCFQSVYRSASTLNWSKRTVM